MTVGVRTDDLLIKIFTEARRREADGEPEWLEEYWLYRSFIAGMVSADRMKKRAAPKSDEAA